MNLTGYLPVEWMKMTNKPGGKSVGEVYNALFFLIAKNSETPSLDAQKLLAHVMERPSSWVMAHPEDCLTPEWVAAVEHLAARMESGEPLPYVLGNWEFFGLEFEVTPDVLIPRPETELLVERAIAWLQVHPDHRHAADIGTGSGCIAIALAANVPDLQVMASDISAEAVKLAQRNAIRNGVAERMEFLCCDLFPPNVEFDLIVANLPYIPTKVLHKLPVYGHEPTLALDGGTNGLTLIQRLLTATPDRLVPGGLLLLEIEASEGPPALSLACDIFAKAEIHLHKDLAGHDRILEVQA
jgi:release factor glutamine methyltransferase